MARSLGPSLQEMDQVLKGLHLDRIIDSTDLKNLTTNEDCFIWAQEYMSAELSELGFKASASKRSMKSERDSEKYRIDGNKYFKDKLYKKSLDLYTKSMIAAPGDNKNGCFSKSLCNRSAALFYLEKYEACLIDIEESIHAGYAKERQYLLFIRKAKCHHALQEIPAAKLAFDKVAELLSGSKIEAQQQDRILKELEKHIGASPERSNAEVKSPERAKVGLPCLPHGKNTSHPSLSSSCKVKYNKKKGRYVVATRDIRPGEVILVEEPYTSLLIGGYDMYCYHCCCRLPIAPISCPDCTKCLFCSPMCRDCALATYHKYECQLGTSLSIDKYYMALRIALVAGIDELLKYGNELSQPTRKTSAMAGCDEHGVYRSCDFNTIRHLVDHGDKEAKRYMCQMSICAAAFERSLENINFFQSIAPDEKESARLCVGKCLIHLMQVYKVNGLSLPGVLDQDTCTEDDEIGLGLYPTYALFNHSCANNSIPSIYANNLVVYASRTVKEGEELSISYNPKYQDIQREERQNTLQQNYHFQCSCEACVNDWPVFHAMTPNKTLAQFKCQKCHQALCPSTDAYGRVQCQGCKKRHDIQRMGTILCDLKPKCDQVKVLFRKKKLSEAFVITREAIEKLENIFFLPSTNPEFVRWPYLLEQCCVRMGRMYTERKLMIESA